MNSPVDQKRRQFLKGAAATGVAMGTGQAVAAGDPTKTQGTPPTETSGRAPDVAMARTPLVGIVSMTPLQKLHGTITPADLHFERHHAGVPAIEAANHELLIHGMVNTPKAFSVADLMRFPSVTRTCFIECSGNLITKVPDKITVQVLAGLTSQSEWTGVPLKLLLEECGLQNKAKWLLAEGRDAAQLSRSITIEKALDDALVVYAQNGEPLRPAQGYPIRLLVPGWEGNTNVKWLGRIDVSDRPFMTREETSKYTEPMKDGTIRQFSVVMDARSVITSPTYPAVVQKGWQEIRGLAWTGRGPIKEVQVSTDAGKTWQTANLQGPVLPKAHTRFTLPWKWDGQPTEIMSRAIDETGYVQPTWKQLVEARGPGFGHYHINSIMRWHVASDGSMTYINDPILAS